MFSRRRRHTRCALVTGVQTCALPIFWLTSESPPESEPVWSTTAPLPVFDWFTVLVDWAKAGAAIDNAITDAAPMSIFFISSLPIVVCGYGHRPRICRRSCVHRDRPRDGGREQEGRTLRCGDTNCGERKSVV